MGASAGAWAILALRVLLVGVERVLLRAFGAGRAPEEAAAAFFGVGALVLLPFAAPWTRGDWSLLRLAAPSGLIYAGAYWLYVSAFSRGEVSAVAPLGALSGVFVVWLASVFYDEPLSWPVLLGAGLISASAIGLQPTGGSEQGAAGRPRRRWGTAEWQMTGYALLTALTRMLDRAAARGAPGSATLYAWAVFTIVALCQCALLAARGRLRGLGELVAGRPWIALAAGTCNGGSFLLLVVAMASLPVSLAEPLTACSLLVSAAIAWLAFREPVRARWLPTLGVIAGTWLLVVGGSPLPGSPQG